MVRILFLIVALSIPSLAQAQNKLDWKRFDWQRFDVDGRPAFVILPLENARTSPLPWVFYAPTFDKSLPNERDEGWMIKRFLDAGIAIAGIDVGESYGNPEGVAAFSTFYDHLTSGEWNFAQKASLLARSRGGLMLYNWASENPDKVVCIIGIYPVCDLESYPGLEKASAAYGMTPAELSASLNEYNPIARLRPLANANIPIFHIHGDADDVVPFEANTLTMSERYSELGGLMNYSVAFGQGHNMWRGFFQSESLVDFVIEYGNPQEWRRRERLRLAKRYSVIGCAALLALALLVVALKVLRATATQEGA